jgi:hypothetical protein
MVLSDFYTFFEEIINTILHRKYNLINFRFEKNFVFLSIDLFSYLLKYFMLFLSFFSPNLCNP